MASKPKKSASGNNGKVFLKVSENLYRLQTTGGYYGLIKKGGKQFRRSLKTTDKALAKRRLNELREQVSTLTNHEDGRLTFAQLGERWIKATTHSLKRSTVQRRELCLRNINRIFGSLPLRKITPADCERWLAKRGNLISASSFAQELGTMRLIFAYAMAQGALLSDPSSHIKLKKREKKEMVIPSRDQFRNLVSAIRISDGRRDSQIKAQPGADMVEFLAYSGCRINEARHVRWRDVDFDRGTLTVTGGEEGTKNREFRKIPMTQNLIDLIQRMKSDRGRVKKDDYIHTIADAKKCIQTACRRLEYPQFSHHDFRHFFATTCIESGVDIPTVSRWLGHKDGGALCMRTYGHLRDEHSASMIKRVTF